MALSWSKIPHVTHADEANITELEKFRLEQKGLVKTRGAKLTLTAFIMKAVSIALQEFPEFNTSFDEKSEEIIVKRYYNLGMAVATERGLIVPVIKSVDKKNIVELALEISEVAEKARLAKIELSQLQGATFTVTNIGIIGGTSATPIIHYPEAAILAVMKTIERPIIKDGKIESGLIVPLCLGFDHRLVDGAEAARFVRFIIKMLEEPKSFEKYLDI
jgi:pyruvate dehydrogenase E2 component (dihydrolipoamide acetyltransferase)